MKLKIVSDLPGRIRLRAGRDVFTAEQEPAIEAYFTSLPHVNEAKANFYTGSILVYYKEGTLDDVLAHTDSLSLAKLVPIEKSNALTELRGFDDQLKKDLLRLIGRHVFRTLFFPSVLKKTMSIFRSLRFLRKGWRILRRGRIGVELLDATAIAASLAQGHYDTASSVMMLLSLSETLEEYTLKKTRSMLTENLRIHADQVWVEEDGEIRLIPMQNLCLGDRVVVRTGTTIPIDGTVLSGEATVNQASMTGEPLGVFKKMGDTVFAGTTVEDGSITIEVQALASDTRISQIVDLISSSEERKAMIQGQAERIADRIVPLSFLLAGSVFAATRSIQRALSVLLVDYSCAIKLATPIAVISAMSEASAQKIVVKGGKFFEAIANADTIVFDKTGTLTLASPTVSRIVPLPGYSRTEVLRLAACMEEHFPHSVARAIVRKAQEENTRHEEEHAEVEYIVAHGISTTIHGKRAIIGSHHFVFEDEGVSLTHDQARWMEEEIGGDSAIYLAVDGRLAGFLCINDPPRPEAAEAISALRKLGIQNVIMLTGDGRAAARLTAEKLGIDRYHAQILPKEKATLIQALKDEGHTVLMVGDGINDSPALAAAHASIAMKDASDIAREVADVTLLSSDLMQLVTLRTLSIHLMGRIHQNFRFIAGFNTLLILLGMGNIITPASLAFMHNASTIGVSAASMRPCLPKAKA